MLPTDDICDCTTNGLVDVGIPGRFVQLFDCLHCGANVSFDSCSLPDSASEMEPPKDPREKLLVTCIMDSCEFNGTVEQLWSHALQNHLEHVLFQEHHWQPVVLPYGIEWMCDTKRFLLHSPFGIYVISLSLACEPLILMVSIEGLDAHWRDFEVQFSSGSDVWSGNLKARTFKDHCNETVFHEVDTSRGLAESLPIISLTINLDDSTIMNKDQTISECTDEPCCP